MIKDSAAAIVKDSTAAAIESRAITPSGVEIFGSSAGSTILGATAWAPTVIEVIEIPFSFVSPLGGSGSALYLPRFMTCAPVAFPANWRFTTWASCLRPSGLRPFIALARRLRSFGLMRFIASASRLYSSGVNSASSGLAGPTIRFPAARAFGGNVRGAES